MEPTVTRKTYAGLFLLTLSTIVFEIVLTRVFSVTMWYHFAFMAISLALFGMAVGAVVVYSAPHTFRAERAPVQLALHTLLFGVTAAGAFLVHLALPFVPAWTWRGAWSVVATYGVIAVPFVFSGIAVCIALTRFPARVSSLYAVDLVGAALGCTLVVVVLGWGDAPTVIFAVAAIAALGALCFALEGRSRILTSVAAVGLLLFAGFTLYLQMRASNQDPLFWMRNVKARVDRKPLHQLWNHHSYLAVHGNPGELRSVMGWGISLNWPRDKKFDQLEVVIDASAGTAMTRYTGRPEEIEHLRWDVVNMAHQVRSDADVLAIGVGGGRDVLSAIAFDQRSITGVEINENMLRLIEGPYADFTGRLHELPNVKLVADEARSYTARTDQRFDIIQVSMIDSFAATAAGAFVLTENSLYTREAWEIFLERLKPRGILTFSRWYYKDKPYEMWRLTALARAALEDQGVTNVADHIIIVRSRFRWATLQHEDYAIGTMLVSREPFSEEDIRRVEQVCAEMGFDTIHTPHQLAPAESELARIITTDRFERFLRHFPINIAPPTDNSPFFFHVVRLRDFLNSELLNQGELSFNNKAITTLMLLVITVVVLSAVFVLGPLFLTAKRIRLRNAWPFLLYFASIGLGFMFVEISQMQRLVIFLGHPTYALTVVLFSVLLSSGVGSFTTNHITTETVARAGVMRLGMLLAVLVVFGLLTPTVVHVFEAAGNAVRVALAVLLLFPLGFFMGMAFPLGMKLAARADQQDLTPWLWGVNGAMSVCASVLSVALALVSGISTAFWTGVGCYVVTVFVAYRVSGIGYRK